MQLNLKPGLKKSCPCTYTEQILDSDGSLTIKLNIIHVSPIHIRIKNTTLITCKLHLEKPTYYSGRPKKENRSGSATAGDNVH